MSDNKQALWRMLARLEQEIRMLEQQNEQEYKDALAALRTQHRALAMRLGGYVGGGKASMTDDFSSDEWLMQATCAVLADGQIIGTAWLVSDEGYLVTAGHLFDEAVREVEVEVEVQFAGEAALKTRRVEWMHNQELGLDFAILKLVGTSSRRPLPISLAKTVNGTFRLCGYGTEMKEQAQASSKGEFLGSVHLDNRPSRRLFRLYSPDLGKEGYSGGAVFSDDLQAVVGIQIEASVRRMGPETNVILAMPLYRVAQWWEPLHKLAKENTNRFVPPTSGSKPLAQEHSTTYGGNSLYVGGHAERNTIVQGNHNTVNSPNAQTGGTRIGSIDATKVTVGADIQGGTPSRYGQVAREILDGNITIKQVKGQDVVVGLRHIANPAQPTQQELRQGLATLLTQLETAIQASEFTDQAAAEDALDDLERVQKELAKPNPDKGRVLRKLRSATNLLTNSESAGTAAHTATSLSADAAVLVKLAQKLFGM